MKNELDQPNTQATKNANAIHAEAIAIVQKYKKCEFELIEILQRVDANKVHYALGYNSLFKYASAGLGLSEEVAYIFISVARKAREVPALKDEIKNGGITVSKAKRIVAVLNPENQTQWLALAKNSSKHELEKQVAMHCPKSAIIDRLNYVSQNKLIDEKVTVHNLSEVRVQLQVGISEELMHQLRRAQELVAQQRQAAVGLEETLAEMVSLFLDKKDPVVRAKRQLGRLEKSERKQDSDPAKLRLKKFGQPKQASQQLGPGTVRRPITALVRHRLQLKHQGQCAYTASDGERCRERKYLHVHHIRPIKDGGRNQLANLELLCAGHHRAHHLGER